MANKEFDDDILLLEGDLVFEDTLLEQLLTSPKPNVAVVDQYQHFMDGTIILAEGGVSKAMVLKKDQGSDFDYSRALKTVNIYKLSGKDLSQLIIPELTRYVVEGKTDQYYEAVFADLVSRGVFELSILRTEAVKWAEIDTIDDIELAEKLFPAMAVPAVHFGAHLTGIPLRSLGGESAYSGPWSRNCMTGGSSNGYIERMVADQRH